MEDYDRALDDAFTTHTRQSYAAAEAAGHVNVHHDDVQHDDQRDDDTEVSLFILFLLFFLIEKQYDN